MTGFGTVKNILRTTNGLEEGIWYEAVIRDHEGKFVAACSGQLQCT